MLYTCNKIEGRVPVLVPTEEVTDGNSQVVKCREGVGEVGYNVCVWTQRPCEMTIFGANLVIRGLNQAELAQIAENRRQKRG